MHKLRLMFFYLFIVITKIMTAILAIESPTFYNKITIGDEIDEAYGSAIYIKKGEEITIENLTYGLMLRSGNDASLAIAKTVSGSVEQFVDLMNSKAKEIGMKNTVFNNPNGLDDNGGNISTAYDMAILTSYAMENELYQNITSTKNYKVTTNMNSYSWTNKHKLLLESDYITGGKTGYTDVAKRTLVTTATKDNMNLVAVTLNDGNDFDDHLRLFEESFDKYYLHTIISKGTINIEDENHYKEDELYIENDFNYLLKKGENSVILNYKLIVLDKYNDKDVVGTVDVIINGILVRNEEILIKVKEKSFFQKLKEWFFD